MLCQLVRTEHQPDVLGKTKVIYSLEFGSITVTKRAEDSYKGRVDAVQTNKLIQPKQNSHKKSEPVLSETK